MAAARTAAVATGGAATWQQAQQLLMRAIDARTFPGASLAIGVGADTLVLDAIGHYTYQLDSPAVAVESCFDCASLSKVVATTTAVMILEEEGVLDIDKPVAAYYPEFAAADKGAVTLRHLLSHTSGLPAFREYEKDGITTRQGVIDAIMSEELEAAAGRCDTPRENPEPRCA